jgi:hypothetical protein
LNTIAENKRLHSIQKRIKRPTTLADYRKIINTCLKANNIEPLIPRNEVIDPHLDMRDKKEMAIKFRQFFKELFQANAPTITKKKAAVIHFFPFLRKDLESFSFSQNPNVDVSHK